MNCLALLVPLRALLVSVTALCLAGISAAATETTFPVEIEVDASQPLGELKPIWRFFGADEPNYVYMKDGEKLLDKLGGLRPGKVYFRTHNLLTSGDGSPALKWGSTNVYTEDEQGKAVYDWTIVDRIFDTLLERDVRPLVEVGFMPKAMSTKPEPYRHEWRPGLRYGQIMTGWRYPPTDYDKWRELVYQWAKHCVERYGADEVATWYWETWNESNINPDGYWGGTNEEFYKLHDYTVAAVREALPNAQVGGPHAAGDGGRFTRDFLEHCLRGKNYATGETGTPLDYIAFHAKGAPSYVDDHVRMGIARQLQVIDRGFGIVARFPELLDTPIVIGESDPEGCAACQGPSFSYRNGTMYSSYTAASFARKHLLAKKHGVNLMGALTWAFEFEDQRYFAGFRQLATNGIPLPVLNVFRMFSRMDGQRLAATSSGEIPLEKIMADGVREEPDVGILASMGENQLCAMVWHYHDNDVPGDDAAVQLHITGLPADIGQVESTHYRIDEHHSNAYAEWLRMGSPLAPNERQYETMLEESELATLAEPKQIEVTEGVCEEEFTLPRQAVSLIVLTWK